VKDYESLFFTDDPEEAFAFVTKQILELRDKDREVFFSDIRK